MASGTDRPLVDLTDDEIREVILSDWLQLTSVLAHEQPVLLVSRLLRIELQRGRDVRLTFVERLRGALIRARTHESQAAISRVTSRLLVGHAPDWVDLQQLGLEEHDIYKLRSTFEEAGDPRL